MLGNLRRACNSHYPTQILLDVESGREADQGVPAMSTRWLGLAQCEFRFLTFRGRSPRAP